MQMKDWKKDVFTIPNMLSLFRLILIPVYVVVYLNAQENADYYLAAAILAVSCTTDMIDGKIARKFNMISKFGQLLDPVADKSTQFALIICLAIRHPILWYLVGLFVAKESFMLIAMLISLKKRQMLPGALMAGKVCTTVLFLSLIILVMLPGLSEAAVDIIALVDAVFMVISLVSYILAYYGKNRKVQNIDEA